MNQATFELRLEDYGGVRQAAGREMAFHGEQHMQWLRAVMRVTANHATEGGCMWVGKNVIVFSGEVKLLGPHHTA